MTESGTVIDCETKVDPRKECEEMFEKVLVHLAKHSPEDKQLFQTTFVTAATTQDKQERHEAITLLAEILCENGDTRGGQWKWPLAPVEKETTARDPNLKAWMEHVAGKIKSLRQAKEWTQEDLANHTGLSQSHVCRIEQCYHAPSYKTLTKIAKELGVSVGDLDPVV